ncbi:MAG: peptide chain release factor N(5)-glutamine methyltransferase [Candidatus Acidiferrales bacterium]
MKQAMARLREARVPSHTLAAELLLMHVLGRDRAWLYAHPEEAIAAPDAEEYFALLEQRMAGVPTQYLTGRQEFWGLQFEVGPGVLIPRPETEHVIEVALARLGPPDANDPRPRGTGLRIADVGAGSGCIAIALASELPGAHIFATDTSAAALAYAHRNAAHHGVASRVHLICCDSLTCFFAESRVPSPESLPFDLIVSNPPYIGRREAETLPKEVRAHEPHEALFAGEQGDEFYAPLADQARNLLRSGGLFVVELGYNALARVQPLLDAPGDWARVEVTHDLAGIPRVLAATRQRN